MLEQLALDFKVIAISETRIRHDSIPHNFEISNYECVSTKTEAAPSGTAIYIHKSKTSKLRSDLNLYKPKFLESTFIETIRPKKGNIVIETIYKHPNMQSCEFVEEFLSSDLDIINKEQKMCVLLGDFNINLLGQESRAVSTFVDTLSSNGFFPTVSLPTRVANNSISLIDNILTNIEKYTTQSGNIMSGISDTVQWTRLLLSTNSKI